MGYLVLVLVAIAAASFYAIIAANFYRSGDGPGWPFHAVAGGFALLLFWAFWASLRFATRLRACTVSRRGDDTLEIRYRWHNGTERIRRLKAPVRLMILLRHDGDEINSWHNVAERGSAPRKERFRDEVQIELYFMGRSPALHLPVPRSRWHLVIPTMRRYFKTLGYEPNCAETVEAALPLAEAVLGVLDVPVEIRVAGGPILRRMEPRGAGQPVPSA